MFEVQDYLSPEGADPYAQWLAALVDRQARARVVVRVLRMATGNFGDCKPLRDGVWELRIDWGARVPRVLRAGWQTADPAAGRRRQAPADGGH